MHIPVLCVRRGGVGFGGEGELGATGVFGGAGWKRTFLGEVTFDLRANDVF